MLLLVCLWASDTWLVATERGWCVGRDNVTRRSSSDGSLGHAHSTSGHNQKAGPPRAGRDRYGEMDLRERIGPTDETMRLRPMPDSTHRMPHETWPAPGATHRMPHEAQAAREQANRRAPAVSAKQTPWIMRWRVPLVWCASIALAALATHILTGSAGAKQVAAFLYSFNFDQERVLLMTTLLMMLGGCAVAGVVFRLRLPAVLGGMLYFGAWYLLPFVQRVQHPPLGPAGLPQQLIPGALTSMTITLVGVALISASVGAALGVAYGELVVTPLISLAVRLWRWGRQRTPASGLAVVRGLPRTGISLALGGLLIYALVLTGAVPGTLLTYGIEGTLYRLAPGAQGKAGAEAHGTVLQATYNSPALGGISRTYFIYLPPSYSLAQAERYPVLYMLHGAPGTPHNWVGAGKAPGTEDALVVAGKMREAIIVSADGTGPVYTFSEWANSYDGRQRMEDAIATDLVHYIDQHYRTLPDAADRAIGGNSEGGFGAVNIALHHPDLFGSVLTMGGYFDAEGSIFGYGKSATPYHLYNSPSKYIFTATGMRAAHMVHFVVCVGTGDGVYYTDGIAFYQQLVQIRAHATLLKNAGGHSWELWALELGESLPLLEPPAQPTGAHP